MSTGATAFEWRDFIFGLVWPMMSPAEIEAYLHAHIPLSADMGVTVVQCDAVAVVLRAPLTPNLNHRSTVFGGSASAVAILAAWAWLNFSLRNAGVEARLVSSRLDASGRGTNP